MQEIFYVKYCQKRIERQNVDGASSITGLGAVLRLERDACAVDGHMTKASNK